MLEIRFFQRDTDNEIIERRRELPEVRFAQEVATILLEHPELRRLNARAEGEEYVTARNCIIRMLDVNPEKLDLRSSSLITFSPSYISATETYDGKLVTVRYLEGHGSDSRLTFCFRRIGTKLKYLPFAEKCDYEVKEDSLAYPWIYLFPEKFEGVMGLSEILTPSEENPLTGLVSSKDAPVRTLTKQVIKQLTVMRDNWMRDIISAL